MGLRKVKSEFDYRNISSPKQFTCFQDLLFGNPPLYFGSCPFGCAFSSWLGLINIISFVSSSPCTSLQNNASVQMCPYKIDIPQWLSYFLIYLIFLLLKVSWILNAKIIHFIILKISLTAYKLKQKLPVEHSTPSLSRMRQPLTVWHLYFWCFKSTFNFTGYHGHLSMAVNINPPYVS